MNNYIKTRPDNPTYEQIGAKGYKYDLENKELGMYYVNCLKGHDYYGIEKHSNKIYYILEGNGKFSLNDEIFDIKQGDLIEININTKYTYAGNMKMLMVMQPDFMIDTHENLEKNDLT